MANTRPSELERLRKENARLIGLLEAHGIAWRSGGPAPTEPAPISEAAPTICGEARLPGASNQEQAEEFLLHPVKVAGSLHQRDITSITIGVRHPNQNLVTSKPEGSSDSWRCKQFGQSIEKPPKRNVAGSRPVTQF